MQNISLVDQSFLKNRNSVSLVFKMKDYSYVAQTIEKIKKMAIGTRLKVEGNKLVPTNVEPKVYRIPDFKDIKQCSKYMFINHTSKPNFALATIGANMDTVVLNTNHICCDGTLAKEMLEVIREDTAIEEPKRIRDSFEVLDKLITEYKDLPMDAFTSPNTTTFTPKDNFGRGNSLFMNKFECVSDAKDLQCYNRETKKVHNLTESYQAQIILALSAYENTFKKQGVKTMVNMRQFLNEKQSFEECNIISHMPVVAHATPESTVQELMQMLKNDLHDKLEKGSQYVFFNYFKKPFPVKKAPGIAPAFSNVGKFVVGGPIKDFYFDISQFNFELLPIHSFSSFSIVDERKGRNDIYTRFANETAFLSPREASLIHSSVRFGLENIKLNTTCAKALEMHKTFQDSFIKNQYPMFSI